MQKRGFLYGNSIIDYTQIHQNKKHLNTRISILINRLLIMRIAFVFVFVFVGLKFI